MKPTPILLAGALAFLPVGTARAQQGLTLERALSQAAEANEIPKVALARIDQARAQLREAWGALIPKLAASASYTRRAREVERQLGSATVTLQSQNAFGANLSLGATLLDLSALPLIARFEEEVDAVGLDAAEARRALAYDVASAFFTVLSAEQVAKAAERRLEVAQTALSDAKARQGAGLSGRNEVTRTELEVANAQLTRTRASSTVSLARLALGHLMGSPVEGPLAEPPPAAPAAGEAGDLTSKALEARQDLKASEARIRGGRQFAREPWLRLAPTLGLSAAWRATNEAGFSGQNTDWSAALTLTWVLYDGGIRYAQAAARSAQVRQAELGADALRRRVALEIRQALVELENAAAAVGQAETRVRVARQNAEEVQERFSQGLATALEHADATASQFEAEADLARQRFAQRLSELALTRALGRWPAGLEEK